MIWQLSRLYSLRSNAASGIAPSRSDHGPMGWRRSSGGVAQPLTQSGAQMLSYGQ